MIDVDVEQRFGAFELAVRFAVDAPIVGVFGASGAGKTSVIDAIAGISTEDIYALTATQGNSFAQSQIDAMTLAQTQALIEVVT